MATKTITIGVNAGNFDKVTPGVVLQLQQFLQRETTKEIVRVAGINKGEPYIIRVDNRWDRRIPQATKKIQAFWQLPGTGKLLKTIWSLLQPETYKFVRRRTGVLGSSWQVYRKDAVGGARQLGNRILYLIGDPTEKIARTPPKQVGANFPNNVKPGAVYTFVNSAPYGSLMSRYSAIRALKGSIAKTVSKSKSDTEFNIEGRLRKLSRSVLYQNTPRGYSTATRIRAAGRRAAARTQAIVRAFDLKPTGNLSFLKRVHGVSVTYFYYLTRGDVSKQGRLR